MIFSYLPSLKLHLLIKHLKNALPVFKLAPTDYEFLENEIKQGRNTIIII